MTGETNLSKLIREMTPRLNEGEYVFVTVKHPDNINREDILGEFCEDEGSTLIMERNKAQKFNLAYSYVASWITLMIHSSLEAVGLTAAIASELAKHNISCNVVAGYYHDHIFVDKHDREKAMDVLIALTKNHEYSK